VGCKVELVEVLVNGQSSASSSKMSLLSLEPMPLVVPLNPNKKAAAWIDGDGTGMTLTFGRKPTGTTWSPVRTNMGRPYRSRPGSRSDDFKFLCDASPQPVVANDFGGTCDSVLVSLTDYPLVSQVPDIPILAEPSLLGAGARCYWRSYSVFHVVFGANAKLAVNRNPPSTLRLRPGSVYSHGSPSYAADGELLVETPATPRPFPLSPETLDAVPYADTPTVYLEGETVVGMCDKLVLVAHVPWAAGARESGLLFSWSSEPDLPVVRRASGEGLKASRVEVPTDDEDFDTATSYTITVTVRSYLGQTAVASKVVRREELGLPTVTIMGDAVQNVRRDRMLVLAANAFLPACVGRTCTCTETVNDGGWEGSSALLELQWAVIGDDENSPLAKSVGIQTSSMLVIPEQTMMSLVVGRTYTLLVEAGVWTGFMFNDIERFATVATVDLKVTPVPPVVRIKHGNRYLQWGLGVHQKRLVLDASESWDPDGQPGNPRLKFNWYLDCPAMFEKLPQFEKDKRSLDRKGYLTACEGTGIAMKIMAAANEVNRITQPDGSILEEFGVKVFDSFLLSDMEGFAEADLQVMTGGDQSITLPFEIIIGLRLTDVDGSSHNDTISIIFTDIAPREEVFPVGLEPLYGAKVRPNDRTLLRIDAATRREHHSRQDNIKYVWTCDAASRHIPLQASPNHVGVLEIPGGLWEGGMTYTVTMTAIWGTGASAETWITFTAAQGPHGGTCEMSARNGSALLDRFSVNCPLWTTADQDLLPVSYSFVVDIGTGTELPLREYQHASYSNNLVLPSSRVTINDPEYGWILCRHFCPVKFITELQDAFNTKTRWTTTLYLRRPGCEDKIAPCQNAVMLDIIDTALRSVDIFAADLRQTNAVMLLLAFELSDLDLFAVNGTVAYSSHFADLRAHSSGQTRPSKLSDVATATKSMRAEAQEKMRQSRMDSMQFLRSLEAQGMYEALRDDIAEALDMEAGDVDVSSGAEHQRLQDQAEAASTTSADNARLQIERPRDA